MTLYRLLAGFIFVIAVAGCSTAKKKTYATPDTPCFKAVIQQDEEALRRVLPVCLNSKTSNGTTPLMLAAAKGYASIVDILIQGGMEVNQPDFHGDTALNYAVVARQDEMVQFLMLNRADVVPQRKDRISPLMIAVQSGSFRMIRALAQDREAINYPAEDGWTPLYFAIRRKEPSILKLLIDRGACPNVRDSYQQTPLDFAIEVKWDLGQKMLKRAKPCP